MLGGIHGYTATFVGPGDVENLPAGMHICLCADDFSKEAEYGNFLLNMIEKSGLVIAGDYVCEVVEEFPGFDAAPRSLFFNIQIPVQKST